MTGRAAGMVIVTTRRRRLKMRLTEAHLALLPAPIEDPGPMPGESRRARPDSYYAATTGELIAALPADGDMWLFACGSLIWNKRFSFCEERPGLVRGWHRDFCLGPDTRYRGSPDAPGYMLSLDRGGQCKGMVYRLPREGLAANIEGMLRKEPPFPPRWVRVGTSLGTVRHRVHAPGKERRVRGPSRRRRDCGRARTIGGDDRLDGAVRLPDDAAPRTTRPV